MSDKQETFGYVGLGNMGAAMATNLQKHLAKNNRPAIVVYNRTASRADPIRALGAVLADSVVDVASRADIILTCLSNDSAVLETYEQLLKAPAADLQGKIFVEQSTVYPTTIAKLAEQVRSKGAILLACPIFGAPPAAISAQLVLIISGASAEHRARLTQYLVPAVGRLAIDLGDDECKAAKMKLTGNYFITSMVEMLAEGLTLGEKSGLGQQNVQKFIKAFFPNTPFEWYAERMVSESYDVNLAAGEKPPFAITNAIKDVSHILELANEHGAKLPISEVMLDHLQRAKEEKGDIDISSVVGVMRKEAGLNFNLKKK